MTIRFKARERYEDDPRNAVSNSEIAWRFLYVALCTARDEQSPFVAREFHNAHAIERLIAQGHATADSKTIAITEQGYTWWKAFLKEQYNVGKHYQRKTEARKPRAKKSTPRN